jgi:HK97 gp10 family phage protein
MSVIWEGLDTWIGKVTTMKERVPEQADAIMEGIGSEALDIMQSNTPVYDGPPDKDHHPGELREGDTLTPIEGGFELSNAVKYAPFVEGGTRKMQAEPYLKPAAEFAKDAMAERLPKALE